jgi:hypothetical protein
LGGNNTYTTSATTAATVMTSKTIAERDRCIAEAPPLKDSPGAGVGRRAAGLPAREDGALGNGSGAGLGANVPEPSHKTLSLESRIIVPEQSGKSM